MACFISQLHLKSKQHKTRLIIHGVILQNAEPVNSNFAFESHPTPSIKKVRKTEVIKKKKPITVKASLSFFYLL